MRYLPLSLALAGFVSCSTPGGPPLSDIASSINDTLAPADYFVAPGDTLEIRFANRIEWNHVSLVQPDGMASFLTVGEIRVGGLRPSQVEERLLAAYQEEKIDEVTVVLVSLAERSVAVLGQVNQPGVYPIAPGKRLTLLDAFALAQGTIRGSIRGQAHMGSVVLVRWDAENQQQLAWTIDARPKYWTGEEMILLQPFDVVYVPQTNIDKVNVFVDKYIRLNIPFPQVFFSTNF